MRILLISSFLPYPLHSGGHVRLFNIIKELSTKNKIVLVCEKRAYQSQKDIDAVKKYCEDVITVDRKKQWSWENILRTAISSYPFLLTGHTLSKMKQKIVHQLNTKKFDVIHIETFYVFQNVPKTYLPTVLVEHNIEYSVYQRFVAKSPLLLRPLLSLDVEKIKYWEMKYWRQATKLVAVSEAEKSQMKRHDVIVVPNGVDLTQFKMKKLGPKGHQPLAEKVKKEKIVLFMGDFKWLQNRDAALFILKEIWPEINLKFQNSNSKLKLWIVGKNIPDSIKQMENDSIVIDENAPDDTAKIYSKSDILLAPIRVGGGTSYKILEAMASGVPVVTTKLGVEGIGAVNKKHAFVGETSQELAQGVVRALEDNTIMKEMRKNARALIESNYSWKEIVTILEGVYQNAKKE